MTRIYHIATAADWRAARASGAYTTSTRGRTLAEEGFIHASRREQVGSVFKRVYAGSAEPLVLLVIDPARLAAPVREEPVGEETYPHIYGPLDPAAVVGVVPLNRKGGSESFVKLWFAEMGRRMGLAIVVMFLAGLGATLAAGRLDHEWAPFSGALGGLVLGVLLVVLLVRVRRR